MAGIHNSSVVSIAFQLHSVSHLKLDNTEVAYPVTQRASWADYAPMGNEALQTEQSTSREYLAHRTLRFPPFSFDISSELKIPPSHAWNERIVSFSKRTIKSDGGSSSQALCRVSGLPMSIAVVPVS